MHIIIVEFLIPMLQNKSFLNVIYHTSSLEYASFLIFIYKWVTRVCIELYAQKCICYLPFYLNKSLKNLIKDASIIGFELHFVVGFCVTDMEMDGVEQDIN